MAKDTQESLHGETLRTAPMVDSGVSRQMTVTEILRSKANRLHQIASEFEELADSLPGKLNSPAEAGLRRLLDQLP